MGLAKKIVVFDAELVFNIRGLQFCLARSNQGLPNELKSEIYHRSLLDGLRLLGIEIPKETLNNYLQTIRPIMNSYKTLKSIADVSNELRLVSFFEKEVLEVALDSLRPFKDLLGESSENIIYASVDNILDDLSSIKDQDHHIVLAHYESSKVLKENGFKVSHVKLPDEQGNAESLSNIGLIFPYETLVYDEFRL